MTARSSRITGEDVDDKWESSTDSSAQTNADADDSPAAASCPRIDVRSRDVLSAVVERRARQSVDKSLSPVDTLEDRTAMFVDSCRLSTDGDDIVDSSSTMPEVNCSHVTRDCSTEYNCDNETVDADQTTITQCNEQTDGVDNDGDELHVRSQLNLCRSRPRFDFEATREFLYRSKIIYAVILLLF